MEKVIDRVFKTHNLSSKEICGILHSENIDYLTEKANQTRENFIGNSVKVIGLMHISNICSQNCLYCDNRKDNPKQRFSYSETDIINIVKEFSKTSIKNIILKTGESSSVSVKGIAEAISRLRIFGIKVIPSLEERNEGEYRMLQEAGAEEIILNLKTSSFTLFGELHPQMNLLGRVAALRFLKGRNIKTCSGILIGFPNQTYSSIADDILLMKEMNIDSVEIIPFMPSKNSPLKDEPSVNIEKVMKIISTVRLLIPNINISISEDINEIDENGMLKCLDCGANIIIKNLTDIDCHKKEIDITSLKETLKSARRIYHDK